MASPSTHAKYKPPQVGSRQLKLLEELSLACAVSGDEGEVRKIVLDQVKGLADETTVDHLGNVLAICRGQAPGRLKVMLAAHMDEVGFMITQNEDREEGASRFEVVGGVDAGILLGKPVWIGREHVPGVIGPTPIHLTKAAERRRTVSIDSMRIDVGPGNSGKVKVGDRATFATPFTRLGASLRGKALDDRLGVATLIELVRNYSAMRSSPANIDLLAAFTVQEEIGLRGAQVSAYAFDPDLAIVLDCTPARDLPSWDGEENAQYNTRLGEGPAIYLADSATISDPRLVRHLIQTAEALNIPYQLRQPGGGGTDAGAIHKQRSGIPSVSVSVPGRYLHTPAGLVRLADWKNSLALVHAALSRLDRQILSTER
jgi:endoglucanase